MVEVFAQKLDRAIDENELCPANMLRLEAPGIVVIAGIDTRRIGDFRRIVAGRELIDRSDGGALSGPIGISVPPAASMVISIVVGRVRIPTAGGQRLAHEDSVSRAVDDIRNRQHHPIIGEHPRDERRVAAASVVDRCSLGIRRI